MKWVDLPPLWLLGFAIVTWFLSAAAPAGLPAVVIYAGSVLVAIGLGLMFTAIFEMRKMRTTVIPHQQASHLVTSGVFGFSRNPIYLGDTLILVGLALRWDAPVALLFVPVFCWVITKRFIQPEEDRLRFAFGENFDHYCDNVRRWV